MRYTVKYSTQPGEVNIPPEGAFEVKGISSTSIVLTALERGTAYYIWVVGMSEGGEGPHSNRMSGVTYDSELGSMHPLYVTAKDACVSKHTINKTATQTMRLELMSNNAALDQIHNRQADIQDALINL